MSDGMWCEATVARFFWGLQRMKPTDARAAEEIAQLLAYLVVTNLLRH